MPNALSAAFTRVVGTLNGDSDLKKLAVIALLSCVFIGVLDSAFARRYAIDDRVRRLFLFGFGGACTTIPRVVIRVVGLPGTPMSHVLPLAGMGSLGLLCLVLGEALGRLF